jgi:hypothetical protein
VVASLEAEEKVAVAPRVRSLTASEAAWLAATPTVVVGALAIVLLGPLLGNALLAPGPARIWPDYEAIVRPEPAEHGRYLMALGVPLLLLALTLLGLRARPRWRPRTIDLLVVAVQVATFALLLICLLQQTELFGPLYPHVVPAAAPIEYFTRPTLFVAAACTLVVLGALRNARSRTSLRRWTQESRRGAVAAGLLAIIAIVVWLLSCVFTEDTLGLANIEVVYHLLFTLDETFAVLNGRTPLVNYAEQYNSLSPYAFAAAMSLLGDTIEVWVASALLATGLGMLAIYAVLRRAAHSSIRGLLLFLPVLATSFFMVHGPLENRYSFGSYFGTFPMRYAGPSILAWVVCRHLSGAAPRRAWPIFLLAGLVALNNADSGLPALGATVAALLWGGLPLTRTRLGRLAVEVAGGLAVAFALVSLMTIVRAGALPDLGLLFRFSRLFASIGFGLYPMPAIGPFLTVYATFVAATGVATVRALRHEPDRALTGMLAWSAIFGLGAGAYYVGRSVPEDLIAIFFPWSFALALMLIPVLGVLGTASWRRAPVAAVACVFGFLVMACSLAQTPMPWEQLHRLRQTTTPIYAKPEGQRFVAQHTHRGESVVILAYLGHRMAVNLGLRNVSPYAHSLSMPTVEQLDETIAQLRAAGGRKFFVPVRLTDMEFQNELERAGYSFVAEQSNHRLGLWLASASRR